MGKRHATTGRDTDLAGVTSKDSRLRTPKYLKQGYASKSQRPKDLAEYEQSLKASRKR